MDTSPASSAPSIKNPEPSNLPNGLLRCSIPLLELATGVCARVAAIPTDTVADNAPGKPELRRRLAELGFLPGERLRIVARGFLGREPVAVRIGTGTYALRRFEAACIRVVPDSVVGDRVAADRVAAR